MTPFSTRIARATSWLLVVSVCLCTALFATTVRGQDGSSDKADKPLYLNYKGVQLGMSPDDVHKKLGAPKEKDDTQDFYVFSEKETAQVFYQQQKVYAISVTYIGAKTGAPEPKEVFGTDVQATADGRTYKLVRYPEAGYWVSYSRMAGEEPVTTVTMQKLR